MLDLCVQLVAAKSTQNLLWTLLPVITQPSHTIMHNEWMSNSMATNIANLHWQHAILGEFWEEIFVHTVSMRSTSILKAPYCLCFLSCCWYWRTCHIGKSVYLILKKNPNLLWAWYSGHLSECNAKM
jgi:tryptophan-rich sensory protein